MIWNDDNTFVVPDFSLVTEFFLEDAKGAWATDIMCQEFVDRSPNVLTWYNMAIVGVAGKDLFCHGHRGFDLHICLDCGGRGGGGV